jgi:hypothetical protein
MVQAGWWREQEHRKNLGKDLRWKEPGNLKSPQVSANEKPKPKSLL